MALRVLELAVLILGIAFLITQIAIPGLTGLPLFPWFRGEKKAKQRLAEAQELTRVRRIERETDREYTRADRLGPPRRVEPIDDGDDDDEDGEYDGDVDDDEKSRDRPPTA